MDKNVNNMITKAVMKVIKTNPLAMYLAVRNMLSYKSPSSLKKLIKKFLDLPLKKPISKALKIQNKGNIVITKQNNNPCKKPISISLVLKNENFTIFFNTLKVLIIFFTILPLPSKAFKKRFVLAKKRIPR